MFSDMRNKPACNAPCNASSVSSSLFSLTVASVATSKRLPMQAASVSSRRVDSGRRRNSLVNRSTTLSVMPSASMSCRFHCQPFCSKCTRRSLYRLLMNCPTKNGLPSVLRYTRCAKDAADCKSVRTVSAISSVTLRSDSALTSIVATRASLPISSTVSMTGWAASTSLLR